MSKIITFVIITSLYSTVEGREGTETTSPAPFTVDPQTSWYRSKAICNLLSPDLKDLAIRRVRNGKLQVKAYWCSVISSSIWWKKSKKYWKAALCIAQNGFITECTRSYTSSAAHFCSGSEDELSSTWCPTLRASIDAFAPEVIKTVLTFNLLVRRTENIRAHHNWWYVITHPVSLKKLMQQ